MTPEQQAYLAWLDEQPCTPNGILVRTRKGETRNVPRPSLAQFLTEYRTRGPVRQVYPRLQPAQNMLAILAHQLKKEGPTDER
jgi:hypothetical protein